MIIELKFSAIRNRNNLKKKQDSLLSSVSPTDFQQTNA